MGQTAKVTRKNRTITVDFHNEATYDQLLDNTKAFVELVCSRRVRASTSRPERAQAMFEHGERLLEVTFKE